MKNAPFRISLKELPVRLPAKFRAFLLILLLSYSFFPVMAEDGYDLWLRYVPVSDEGLRESYSELIQYAVMPGTSPTMNVAREELTAGITGMLEKELIFRNGLSGRGAVIVGTPTSNNLLNTAEFRKKAEQLGEEGYALFRQDIGGEESIVILAGKDQGVLYGIFHFLRLIQTQSDLSAIDIREVPLVKYRLLNHWDNPDRTVERGYAGFSIWDWHRLPNYRPGQYTDYARANASIGINGTVLTNVNANAYVLTDAFLEKVAALADIFRPYGIRVYLTARFSAPVELGGLKTADPLDGEVASWWAKKVSDIYKLVPDFGGFLVKANSEGQPGPQDYGRSHADGANMLADALAPYGGIVMWRAFVYDDKVPDDRAKQAYDEFVPLDGHFRDNVIIQVKNGPIDFQPREPFHPLFGAMPQTPVSVELQITQEYLGQATQLVFLAPLFKECLDSDTYIKGEGSPVSSVVDGSLFNQSLTCMAGVSNIGNDGNWTGHQFGQANWYAFGRLAWDHNISAKQIADEWLRMTFTDNPDFLSGMKRVMLRSREIAVQYMTPLGLHHIMGRGHHYGPGPWVNGGRADWTSVYYHRADLQGIGFDRTATGSDAVSQYSKPLNEYYSDLKTCPDKFLLWFHHLPWDYTMRSGQTLWNELCLTYQAGVDSAVWMQSEWNRWQSVVDPGRFDEVASLLSIQVDEAEWWRDACLLYFQTFSNRTVPEGVGKPAHSLEYYEKLRFPYAPGIRPTW